MRIATHQAINRVSIDMDGNLREQSRKCLLMPYTKSVASSVLAALDLVGAPLHQMGNSEKELRILCIGFGGGSVPAFLADMIPHCLVDVVELEPAVLEAADSMGFEPHPRIRLHLADGANFVSEAVRNTEGPLVLHILTLSLDVFCCPSVRHLVRLLKLEFCWLQSAWGFCRPEWPCMPRSDRHSKLRVRNFSPEICAMGHMMHWSSTHTMWRAMCHLPSHLQAPASQMNPGIEKT